VLALGLFDLMAPLALKVAAVHGRVDTPRRQQLNDYFVGEWGYDADFVDAGMQHIESRLGDVSVQDLAHTLAEFASQNRDCNFHMMSREILEFLHDVAAADGVVEDSEENAIAEIERIFKRASRFSLARKLRGGWRALKQKTGRILLRRPSTER
jgi:tellurite resistance protein